ncbi:hypothetical protein AB6A23_10990 [Paenibacillus tarimensis]
MEPNLDRFSQPLSWERPLKRQRDDEMQDIYEQDRIDRYEEQKMIEEENEHDG